MFTDRLKLEESDVGITEHEKSMATETSSHAIDLVGTNQELKQH